MYTMTDEEILKEDNWDLVCEGPMEIEDSDGNFARGRAVYAIMSELRQEKILSRIILIRDSYKGDLIDKEKFVEEMLKIVDENYE